MLEQSSTRKLDLVDTALYSQYRDVGRWAVIVGVSKYQDSNLNLKYADRDAEALHQLLLTPEGGGFQDDHIRILTNEQATTGNINHALRSFLKKPAREDLVLIYFACHGSPDPDRPANVYLLTYDTDPNDIAGTALPMEDIDRAVKGALHSEKVIILADTCHSAAIGGGIGERRSVGGKSARMNQFLQQMSQSKGGVALLTSAEANEVSFEDAKWGGGHGVFTHYLLQGMRGAGDRDCNGIVTIGELFDYVIDNVQKATDYRQHPSKGTNAFDRKMPIAISDETRFAALSDETNFVAPSTPTDTSTENPSVSTSTKITTSPKSRILIGAVCTTAAALVSIFLVKAPQLGQKVESASTVSSTMLLATQTSTNFAGQWDGGAVISVDGNSLVIDMSAVNRSNATGLINPQNPLEAVVTFPDNGIFTARLSNPDLIEWSNGTHWTRTP